MSLNKFNWASGALPMPYKLVLGPTPILHINVHENPLTTFGFTDILKLFKELTPPYLPYLILHKYKTTLYLTTDTKSFNNDRHTHGPQ